jgi:hypothetical protein
MPVSKIKFEKLKPEEAQAVGGTTNISSILLEGMANLEPGEGARFGPFDSEEETKDARKKIGLTARKLGWDTGIENCRGKKGFTLRCRCGSGEGWLVS